ncbi:hypothetical protein FACS1894186_6680 [Alphaproteobacteria bacterium]|nr:hypothetical protein FACS1894186_6680 [Alphaproteobacteria bacterium]
MYNNVEEMRAHAAAEGFRLNEDTAPKILKALERCKGYCPCKPDHIGDAPYLCPCEFHKADVAEKGKCCCNLFIK